MKITELVNLLVTESSYDKIAELLNVSAMTIRNWESGKTIPDFFSLKKMVGYNNTYLKNKVKLEDLE